MPFALRPGEVILWSGQPDPSVHFRRVDSYFVPASLVMLAVSVWRTVDDVRYSKPIVAVLAGLIVVLVSLYLVAGRFLVKAWVKRRTRYFLTNQRAVSVGPTTDWFERILGPVEWRAHGTHVDITFTVLDAPMTAGERGTLGLRHYANMGLDFAYRLGPDGSFAFYDIKSCDTPPLHLIENTDTGWSPIVATA